mmetsp:Transcript_22745/g.57541  ORF Transcript_22745/g.57541 Transcript_22745/m.57541 type:complete len:745 (-) Transcript_22745:1264-3498(-)
MPEEEARLPAGRRHLVCGGCVELHLHQLLLEVRLLLQLPLGALLQLLLAESPRGELGHGVVDDAQPCGLVRHGRLAAPRAVALLLEPLLEAGPAEDVLLLADRVGVEHQRLADGARVLVKHVVEGLGVHGPRLGGLQLRHDLGRRRPLVGVVREELAHDGPQPGALQLGGLDRLVHEVLVEGKDADPAPRHHRHAREELREHAPHRPHVVLVGVGLGARLLGGRVRQGPRARARLVARGHAREPEVGDLELLVLGRKKHVVRLEVAVDHLLGVDVLQRLAELQQDLGHPLLGNGALRSHLGHEARPGAPRGKLHHDAEETALLVHVASVVPDDVVVCEAKQHLDLPLQVLHGQAVAVRLVDVDHLYGVELIVHAAHHRVRLAKGPLPQKRLVLVGVEREVVLGGVDAVGLEGARLARGRRHLLPHALLLDARGLCERHVGADEDDPHADPLRVVPRRHVGQHRSALEARLRHRRPLGEVPQLEVHPLRRVPLHRAADGRLVVCEARRGKQALHGLAHDLLARVARGRRHHLVPLRHVSLVVHAQDGALDRVHQVHQLRRGLVGGALCLRLVVLHAAQQRLPLVGVVGGAQAVVCEVSDALGRVNLPLEPLLAAAAHAVGVDLEGGAGVHDAVLLCHNRLLACGGPPPADRGGELGAEPDQDPLVRDGDAQAARAGARAVDEAHVEVLHAVGLDNLPPRAARVPPLDEELYHVLQIVLGGDASHGGDFAAVEDDSAAHARDEVDD